MYANQLRLGDVVESEVHGLQRIRALAWLEDGDQPAIMIYYRGPDQLTEKRKPWDLLWVIGHAGTRVSL